MCFFVPTPTNGTMPYDLYYRTLHAHHDHVANLRSFAITNVGDLKAEMTFTEPNGKDAPRTTTFEAEIMRENKTGTTEKLFYSIEPTKYSDTEGRYLLVTHKDNIAEAEKFIDFALQHLTTNCPDNMAKIMRSQVPVTRANRISTSDRFQTYVTKLQSMIPATISMSVPTENAWKRRPPTTMNLTDADFPSLEKKQRIDNATVPDTATTTDATESITTIDLDEIEKAQNDMKEALILEIATLREETKRMQTMLQEQFTSAMHQLEIRMETNTQTMLGELGQALNQAVNNMNAQAARADTMLQTFKKETTQQNSKFLQSIRAQISSLRPSNRKNWDDEEDDSEDDSEDDDAMEEQTIKFGDQDYDSKQPWARSNQQAAEAARTNETADGSHNPKASRASHPKHGMDASTGGIE
jgi:hypothetical protein